MTVVKSVHSGRVVPLPRSELVRADPGEAIGAPPAPSNSNLQNVVPFLRPRSAEAHAPAVVLPGGVVRPHAASLARDRVRLAGFAAISLLVHGALFAAFWREPDPLASIGVEVITAEIIIGATAPAGVAPTPGEQQDNSPAVAAEQKPDEQAPETQQQATEQPQNVQTARQETAPEPKTEQPKAEEKIAKPEPSQPAEQKPAVAMIESPTPDTATAAPREVPPDATELSLLPQPEKPLEPKTESKPVPKPVQAAPPKPVKDAAPAKERRRIEAPTKDRAVTQAKASTPATAANSVGIGRSDASSNYPGLVSAHLRRYQQYPSDARSRGDQGTATISFNLDGGGRVTSSRLARGSGIASIDSEVQAMVRRAAPFPAPPGGAPRSFTVPVSFRLN
ncbi:MAG: periplasmic protein TonB [Hyphomicrobiales bacterium]